MKAQKLSEEQVLNHSHREYNPSAWTKVVERYRKYSDVEFYLAEGKDNGYGYDQFFVVYTLPSGIRFLNALSYSSMLSNSPFGRADIFADGDGYYTLSRGCFYDQDGKAVYIANTTNGREFMAERSTKYGLVFTTQGL